MLDQTVVVRRQWNDWRRATYRMKDVEGFHWSDVSGGINARANRAYLHAYVWCDGMLEGDLAHSCQHGEGPHRIKICIVKKDNPNSRPWEKIEARPAIVEAKLKEAGIDPRDGRTWHSLRRSRKDAMLAEISDATGLGINDGEFISLMRRQHAAW